MKMKIMAMTTTIKPFPVVTMMMIIVRMMMPMMIVMMMMPKIHSVSALMQYQRLDIKSSMSGSVGSSSSFTMRLNPTKFDGSDMTIVEYPRPILRLPNAPITKFFKDDPDFKQICTEMISIMYQASGVGLAAPQIGLNLMLFVYNPTGDPKEKSFERIVCNPIIKEYSKETDIEEEGCLSSRSDDCPGLVERSKYIMVEYQNEVGQKIIRRLKGFEARVFQHEYDHLQGILHFDRFHPNDKERNIKILQTLINAYNASGDGDEGPPLLDPDPKIFQTIQPPPLTAGRMPPIPTKKTDDDDDDEGGKKTKVKKEKTGFGGGGATTTTSGFGGSGGGKNTGKKKKKK